MRPTKIILNPVAGRGYGARAEPELRRLLELDGVDFELVHTSRPWHAAELAEEAANDGFGIVVAAGGDGDGVSGGYGHSLGVVRAFVG